MIKRLFDILVSLTLLILLSPIFAITSLLIAKKLGSPVLFRQQRPGKNGEIFQMIKFRTMSDAKSKDGSLLSDEQRVTAFGNKLRSSSIDELPELWNVLKGDMSLVGPRPLLVEYLERYDETQSRRHLVKPGITGWAQVNGRNAISWQEKFEYDVWYVENASFLLDIKILIKTVSQVFKKTDINEPGHATMTEFKGNKDK